MSPISQTSSLLFHFLIFLRIYIRVPFMDKVSVGHMKSNKDITITNRTGGDIQMKRNTITSKFEEHFNSVKSLIDLKMD